MLWFGLDKSSKGKYFAEKQGRNSVENYKEKLKTFLFLHIIPYSSLFFCIFGSFDHIMRIKMPKYGVWRQLWLFG